MKGAVSHSYLRELDTALQEGAVSSVVGADVAVLAPVAGEGAVHAGQAAAEGHKWALLGQHQGTVHRDISWDAPAGQHPQVILYLEVERIPYPWGTGQALGGRCLHSLSPHFAHGRVGDMMILQALQDLCPS